MVGKKSSEVLASSKIGECKGLRMNPNSTLGNLKMVVISDFQQVGSEIEGPQRGRSMWTDKHGSDSHVIVINRHGT